MSQIDQENSSLEEQNARLKDLNTTLLVPDARSEVYVPITQRTLIEQRQELFKAFVTGNQFYIYKFSSENMKKRESFKREFGVQVIRDVFMVLLGNYSAKQFLAQARKAEAGPILTNPFLLFGSLNLAILGFSAFQLFRLYLQVDEYLDSNFKIGGAK